MRCHSTPLMVIHLDSIFVAATEWNNFTVAFYLPQYAKDPKWNPGGDNRITFSGSSRPALVPNDFRIQRCDGDGNLLPLQSIPANIAKRQPTSQSSDLAGKTADLTVDGNTDSIWGEPGYSCTHTKNDKKPWWQVDLQVETPIQSVKVWNRADCCGDRLNGFQIFISNSSKTPRQNSSTLPEKELGLRCPMQLFAFLWIVIWL